MTVGDVQCHLDELVRCPSTFFDVRARVPLSQPRALRYLEGISGLELEDYGTYS